MPEKLILNDGTEFAGHAIEVNGILWVYADAMSLGEGYELLGDPAKTRIITADEYGAVTAYTAYTHLFSLQEESGGRLSAGLRKEAEG